MSYSNKFQNLTTFQRRISSPLSQDLSENISFLNSADLGSSTLNCNTLLIKSGLSTHHQLNVAPLDHSGTIKTSMVSSSYPSENTQEIQQDYQQYDPEYLEIGDRILIQDSHQNQRENEKELAERVRIIQQKLNQMNQERSISSIDVSQYKYETVDPSKHVEEYKLKKQSSDEDFFNKIRQKYGEEDQQQKFKIQKDVQEKIERIEEIQSQRSGGQHRDLKEIIRNKISSSSNSFDYKIESRRTLIENMETKRTQKETNPTQRDLNINNHQNLPEKNNYKRDDRQYTFQSKNFDPESTSNNLFVTSSPLKEQAPIPTNQHNRQSISSATQTPLTGNSIGRPSNTLNTMYIRPDGSSSPSKIVVMRSSEEMSPDAQPFKFAEVELRSQDSHNKIELRNQDASTRVAQKFTLSIKKVEQMIEHNTKKPSFSHDLQTQISHRNKLQQEIAHLQNQKSQLESKDDLYNRCASMQTDLQESSFRIQYLERLCSEKDTSISDYQLQILNLKEQNDRAIGEQKSMREEEHQAVKGMWEEQQEVKKQQKRIGEMLREFFLDYEGHTKNSTLREQVDLMEVHISQMKNKQVKRKKSKTKYTSIRGGIPKNNGPAISNRSPSFIEKERSSIMDCRSLKKNSSVGDFSFRVDKQQTNLIIGNSKPKSRIDVPPRFPIQRRNSTSLR